MRRKTVGFPHQGFRPTEQTVRRKKTIQWALALVLVIMVAAIILAALLLSGDRKDKASRAVFDILSDTADLEVKDFRYSQVGDPDFQWEVRAHRASYYKTDEALHLEKVSVRLLTEEGRTYHMTGDRGTLDSDSGNMTLSGSVLVLSDQGERLITDVLSYRSYDRTVYTDEPVEMRRQNLDLFGKGMTFALEGNDLVLFSDVKAVITNASLFR